MNFKVENVLVFFSAICISSYQRQSLFFFLLQPQYLFCIFFFSNFHHFADYFLIFNLQNTSEK